MTTARPRAQHQGPAQHCIIDGKWMGWLSCTCYSMAMGIDKSTLGVKAPLGCSVRAFTLDTTGGTTLPQVADVAYKHYGVVCELHTGSNVARPAYVAAQCASGRGFVLQGNTRALIGTPNQSTATGVNHAVWVNEVRGGTVTVPKEALVYDPAADGRKRGYHVDTSPSWWPWSRVLAFAAAIRPWGDTDPRTLGAGWMYVGLMPDTEPHVILRPGARKTKPFPDRTRVDCPKTEVVNVRSAPDHKADNVVSHLDDGDVFTAYQVTDTGSSFHGSKKWYGNQKGTGWVHAARLIHEGGAT